MTKTGKKTRGKKQKEVLLFRLKKTARRLKKNTRSKKPRVSRVMKRKRGKIAGGGYGMPLKYFGGETPTAWAEAGATSAGPLLDGTVGPDFSHIAPF